MTIKSLTVSALALTTLLAAPVYAGSPAPAPADPVVPVVIPVTGDWTGPYLGVELGYGDATASTAFISLSDNGMLYGITAGYDHDFGNWVLGVGFDYDMADLTFGAVNVESIARLKVRGGVDLGDGLLYGVAAAARADTNLIGNDTGWAAGLGYEHRLGSNWALGGEALYHSFDNFNGFGVDIEATTIAVRVVYRF
ncbi:outer membrane protein [Marimonas arenosa]|uniref:Porin family protein n=1 Tax=Marimonas arenosa TaxID=1795305 RepID=A0AAE4B3T0_9RHOB|nr:outer membrane beta-barrel protein [Marimonas arenosa]MDQ2089527.1 porin family protein [Marimonas arenosa]